MRNRPVRSLVDCDHLLRPAPLQWRQYNTRHQLAVNPLVDSMNLRHAALGALVALARLQSIRPRRLRQVPFSLIAPCVDQDVVHRCSSNAILALRPRCVKRSRADCERIGGIQEIGFCRRAGEAPTVHDHSRREHKMDFRAIRDHRVDSCYVLRGSHAFIDRGDPGVSRAASPRLDPHRVLLRINRVNPLAELAIVASAPGATSRAQRETVLRYRKVNENDPSGLRRSLSDVVKRPIEATIRRALEVREACVSTPHLPSKSLVKRPTISSYVTTTRGGSQGQNHAFPGNITQRHSPSAVAGGHLRIAPPVRRTPFPRFG